MSMFFFLDIYIPINGKQHLKLNVYVFCFSWAHYFEVQDFFFSKKDRTFIQKVPPCTEKGRNITSKNSA